MSVLESLDQRQGAPTARRFPAATVAALSIYAVLILIAHVWGNALASSGARTGLGAPPLFGRVDLRLTAGLLASVAMAAAVAAFGDRIASQLAWRPLLGAATAGTMIWAVALAVSDGVAVLAAPILNPLDAFAFLPEMPPAGEFVRTFTDRLAGYPIHVQGHPPGLPLLLGVMDAINLARPEVVAALYIGGGAAAIPAVLVAVRRVAGEAPARASAPWLVLAPFALWIATSADALYLGVAAWGVALCLPVQEGTQWRSTVGGVLLGLAAFLTYGAAALALVPLTVAVARRSFGHLWYAAAGGAAVVVAFALAGFWWWDGLAATRIRYHEGLGGVRPYGFFLLSNFAALAIACGPAAVRGLVKLDHPARLLAAGSLVAVTLANLSGLSKGEVERIWLLFMPWIVVAAGGIEVNRRRWLAAAGGSAVAVQALVVMPW